jgi:hypothetical protein
VKGRVAVGQLIAFGEESVEERPMVQVGSMMRRDSKVMGRLKLWLVGRGRMNFQLF